METHPGTAKGVPHGPGQELESNLFTNHAIEAIGATLQKLCREVQQYFDIGHTNAPLTSMLDALNSLRGTISGISQQAPTAQEKITILRLDVWPSILFPTIESCCFCARWHTLAFQLDTTSDRSSYASYILAVRDLLKDALLPLLIDAVPAQNSDIGLCLAPHLHFILRLASTGAEVAGWRDPSAATAPSQMRHFGILNAIWVALVQCWPTIPAELQPAMDAYDLSPVKIVSLLLDCLKKDLIMLCEKKNPTDTKLLQFWIVNLKKVMAAFPNTAALVWDSLVQWAPLARVQVERVKEQGGAEVSGFIEAVRSCSLWIRLSRLQAEALSLMPTDKVNEAVQASADALRFSRTRDQKSNFGEGNLMAVATLLSAADLLGRAHVVPPAMRAAFLSLFHEVLRSVPTSACGGALATSEQCRNIANSCLGCALSFATAAASEETSAPEGSSIQRAWEDCQMYIAECSMIPHPSMLAVLSMLWSSLASFSEPTTMKHFISALYELLSTTAAVQAASDRFQPASATNQQLCHLLGALLRAAPVQMAEGFCGKMLQLPPAACIDRCQLASLAAVLRATATLRNDTCSAMALPLVRQLCETLQSAARGLSVQRGSNNGTMKTQAAAFNDPLHLAWLLDCVSASLECITSLSGADVSSMPPPAQFEAAVAAAVQHTTAILTSSATLPAAPYIAPGLDVLQLAWEVHPNGFSHAQLDALLPCLEIFLQNPTAAAGIARFTPAYIGRPSPPKTLFEAILGPCPSASLQVLGREAFVRYARECQDANVWAAVPKHLMDPTCPTQFSKAIQPIMQQYVNRIPMTALDVTPGLNIARVAPAVQTGKLEMVANTAPQQLGFAATEAVRGNAAHLKQQEDAGTKFKAVLSINSSLLEVSAAVERLKAAWDPSAMNGSSENVEALKESLRQVQATLGSLIS